MCAASSVAGRGWWASMRARSQARPYRGPFSAAAPGAPGWELLGLPSQVAGRGARRKPLLLRRRIGPAVCAVTAVTSMYRVRCCLLTVSPDNHTAGVCTDEIHSYWSLGVHQGPSPSLLPPHMRTHTIPTITAILLCRAPTWMSSSTHTTRQQEQTRL